MGGKGAARCRVVSIPHVTTLSAGDKLDTTCVHGSTVTTGHPKQCRCVQEHKKLYIQV